MNRLSNLYVRFMILFVLTLFPIIALVIYSGLPDMGLVLAAIVLSFLSAWVASDFLILRRVNHLLVATERLSAGDLGTRLSVPRPLQDWSQLSATFNRMAESLQMRELELRETETKYRSLVEQIPAVTYIARLDASSSALFVSPQIELFLGFSQKEWLADPDAWIKQIYPADRERVLGELELAHSTGVPFCSEYRLVTKDRRAVWVRDQAVIVRDARGQPLFLQGILLDIDEQKLSNEEVRRLNAQLEHRVTERTAELEETNRVLTHEIAEHARSDAALRESEERFRLLAENAQDLIFRFRLTEPAGFEYTSPSSTRVTGYPSEEFYKDGDLLYRLVHPEDRGIMESALRGEAGPGSPIQMRWVRKDGVELWMELVHTPIYDEAGRLSAIEGIARDISERKRAEQALQDANDNLTRWAREMEQRKHEAETLNRMGDLLQSCFSVEEAYHVVAASAPELFPNDSGALYILNPSKSLVEAVATWGETDENGRGRNLEEVFVPDHCWAMRRGRIHIVTALQSDLICQHARRGNESGTKSYLCVPMLAQSETIGVLYLEVGAGEQLTESKQHLAVSVSEHIALALSSLRLRESLHSQAIRDPLTGLYNRRYMAESLERELRRAARRKATVGVIMLDMDHFKRFNDSFGHEAGDAVLRTFGKFLQRQVREEDIACRYGGEEFTIILPDASLANTQARAEQIRSDFKQSSPQYHGHSYGSLSVSVGVAIFPEHGTTVEGILRAADLALYRAKAGGRNRIAVADSTSKRYIENDQLTDRL